MRISEKNSRELEKKTNGLDENPPSMVELRKGLKEFFAGLIS
jgi:hypothetical protein